VAVAIEAEFHAASIHGFGGNESALNDPEKSRLDELFIASRSLVEPIDLEKNVRIKFLIKIFLYTFCIL